MSIDFHVKDILHKIVVKFAPARLPEAKKTYRLKTVHQPVLDIHDIASKGRLGKTGIKGRFSCLFLDFTEFY
ncbi:MAG: hypothetical protein LBH44_08635 [Treponema sp.]|jgi:hypothetical protein|nr:hypothetical protein [Treponema sp.]